MMAASYLIKATGEVQGQGKVEGRQDWVWVWCLKGRRQGTKVVAGMNAHHSTTDRNGGVHTETQG